MCATLLVYSGIQSYSQKPALEAGGRRAATLTILTITIKVLHLLRHSTLTRVYYTIYNNNKVTRKNLRLRLGDVVTVHEAPDVKYATVVQVLPYSEDLEGVSGEMFETFLQPFFEGEFKPVSASVQMFLRQVGPVPYG